MLPRVSGCVRALASVPPTSRTQVWQRKPIVALEGHVACVPARVEEQRDRWGQRGVPEERQHLQGAGAQDNKARGQTHASGLKLTQGPGERENLQGAGALSGVRTDTDKQESTQPWGGLQWG